MTLIDYAILFAASLLIGVLVGFVAKRVTDAVERTESEENELLRIQLGDDPIRVHGMPDGAFRPDQVQDDDPYVRAMVAAAMNAGGPVCGNIDRNGELHIDADKH